MTRHEREAALSTAMRHEREIAATENSVAEHYEAQIAKLEAQNVEMLALLQDIPTYDLPHAHDCTGLHCTCWHGVRAVLLASPRPPLIGVLERAKAALEMMLEYHGMMSHPGVKMSAEAVDELNRYLPATGKALP